MKRLMIILVALSMGALLVAGCGGGGETTTPEENATTSGPIGQSESTACAANRNAISRAAQQYQGMEGVPPSSIQQLVPGYLQSVPACPSGGMYTLRGTTVTCSVHGS